MRQFLLIATVMIVPAYSQTVIAPASPQPVGGIIGGGVGVGLAAVFTGPGVGVSSRGTDNQITFNYTVQKGATVFAVTGAPYSGHSVNQTVRTLANGTHLTQPSFEQPMTYRDSMGRVRTESRMQPTPMMGGAAKTSPQIASLPEIEDPVSGYRIILDTVGHIAHRIPVQVHQNQAPNINNVLPAPRLVAQPAYHPREDGVTVQTENLGTDTIFGVSATGRRTTTTYPVGTYQGNDQPVTMVNEMWNSVQYGMVLKSSNAGPESDSTMTMKDFSTAEPDSSLFQIPAGYQIMDETGDFSVTIPRNQ